MTASTARVSGADIVVPSSKPATRSAPAPVDALLQNIRVDLDGCRTTDRNVLLTIAIEALVDAGVDTGPQIVGAAVSLGFPRPRRRAARQGAAQVAAGQRRYLPPRHRIRRRQP